MMVFPRHDGGVRQTARAGRNKHAATGLAIALAVATGILAASARAQTQPTVTVGGSGLPSIEVDLSVLDQRQQQFVAPQLLYPGTTRPPLAPVTLRPPKSMAAKDAPAAPTLAPTAPPSRAATGDRIVLRPPTARAAPRPEVRGRPIPAPRPVIAARPAPIPKAPKITPPAAQSTLGQSTPAQTAAIPAPAVPKAPTPMAETAAPPPPPVQAMPKPRAVTPPAAPPPPPEKAPAETAPGKSETPPPPKVAALPPAETPAKAPQATDGGPLRLTFAAAKANLQPAANAQLTALAARLTAEPAARVQLKAFAAGTAETASQARRLSLSRALAVRSFLIDKGIESTRMDVRALGTKFEEGPPDRVDILIVTR